MLFATLKRDSMFSSIGKLLRLNTDKKNRKRNSRASLIRKPYCFESLESREVFAGTPLEYIQTISNPDAALRTDLRVGEAVAMNSQYTIVSVPNATTNDTNVGFTSGSVDPRYPGRLLVYDTTSGNL